MVEQNRQPNSSAPKNFEEFIGRAENGTLPRRTQPVEEAISRVTSRKAQDIFDTAVDMARITGKRVFYEGEELGYMIGEKPDGIDDLQEIISKG